MSTNLYQQYSKITEAGVLSDFQRQFKTSNKQQPFVTDICTAVRQSDTLTEKHAALGTPPMLTLETNNLTVDELTQYEVAVENQAYGRAIAIPYNDYRYDKANAVTTAIQSLANNGASLWNQIVTDAIAKLTNYQGYDGQPFFSDTHYNSQSNLKTYDVANPQDSEEMQDLIANIALDLMGFEEHVDAVDAPPSLPNQHVTSFGVLSGLAYGSKINRAVNLLNGGDRLEVIQYLARDTKANSAAPMYKSFMSTFMKTAGLNDKFIVYANSDDDVKPLMRTKLHDPRLVIIGAGDTRADQIFRSTSNYRNKVLLMLDAAYGITPTRWERAILCSLNVTG